MKQFAIIAAGLVLTCSLLGLTTGQAYAACSGPIAPAKEHSATAFVPAVYHPRLASADFITLSAIGLKAALSSVCGNLRYV